MRGGRQAVLAVVAATLAVTGSVATAATPAASGGTAVTHRLAVTSPGGSAKAESSSSTVASTQQWLRLPTRSRVWFTVPRRTIPSIFFGSMTTAAGRYEAFYFRDLDQGSALLPDPGSSRHWPTILRFGSGFGFTPLLPGRVYSVDVALDRPARVQMPFEMHVVRVRAESFPAAVVIHPLSLLAPVTPAVADSAVDSLGRLTLSTTAIAVDWKTDPSPVSNASGDACPSTAQTMSCVGRSNMSYDEDTYEIGVVGGAHQLVMGEAFDSPAQAAYISAYATSLPMPFDAATIYGFAMAPPGILSA